MFRLWRGGHLTPAEEAWWAEVRSWFNLKLEKPERFARSRRRGAASAGISWFKESAVRHIARAREVASLLAEHHIASRMVRTDKPGYIVYEDEFQVTAEPFRTEIS